MDDMQSKTVPPTALAVSLEGTAALTNTAPKYSTWETWRELEGNRILVLERWMPFQTNKDQIIKDKSESGGRAPESNSDKITRRHRVQR